MMNFRTDLALERRDLYRKANHISNEVDGIETQEELIGENIKITRVKVLNENGEQAIGKKKGNYITIDIKNMKIPWKRIRINKCRWNFRLSDRKRN